MKNARVGLATAICFVVAVGCHRSVTEDKHTHQHHHGNMIELEPENGRKG